MAESKETSQKYGSVKDDKTAESTLRNTRNSLHSGVGHKIEEMEDIRQKCNAVVSQEKNMILQTTTELQELIINVLQQELKFSDLRNKYFMYALSNNAKNVQKAADEAERKYSDISGENISEFQVIIEFLDSVRIEKEEDFNTEKFVEECQDIFLKYEATYTKSKFHLRHFLKNLENVLKNNELPRNCEVQEHVLFSIFKEKLASYNSTLASSERGFNEFESLIKNDIKNAVPDIDKTINLILNTFYMAEFAFKDLKTLAVEVLKIDFVNIG